MEELRRKEGRKEGDGDDDDLVLENAGVPKECALFGRSKRRGGSLLLLLPRTAPSHFFPLLLLLLSIAPVLPSVVVGRPSFPLLLFCYVCA
jgi:hypothetical protein